MNATLRRRLLIALAMALAFAVIAYVIFVHPAIETRGRRRIVSNDLKQIGLGLYQYENANGSFPAAISVDSSGRTLHSWRGQIVGYWGLPKGIVVNSNRAWDNPANYRVARTPMFGFRNPRRPESNETKFVAVVGQGFAFDGSKSTRISEIVDGVSRTILAVEVVDSGIPWIKPQDLSFEELMTRIDNRTMSEDPEGFLVLWGDARVSLLRYDEVDANSMKAILTIAGGEP